MQYFSGSGYIRERYPAALADFIQLAELEGNMFNENYYAGYLIWRLSPEHHRVFSDPRFDIFGGTIWQAERIIAAGAEEAWLPAADGAPARRTSWHEELDRYDVQWLITREGTGLERALHRTSGDWVRAANWPALNWQIWIRNTSENAAMIQRAQATAPLAGAD